MPEETIKAFIAAARNRRWAQVMVRRLAGGVTVGCVLAAGVSLLAMYIPGLDAVRHGLICIASGALAGLAAGAAARDSLKSTALQIDQVASLKDRVHSALQFSAAGEVDEFRRLAINDAARSVRWHKVESLFPWFWPREGTWAAVSGVLAAAAILLTPAPRVAEAYVPQQPPAVAAEVMVLQQQLEEFEQAAQQLDSSEMRELNKRLRELLSEMKEEANSVEDAMLRLARMAAAVDAVSSEFNPLLLQQALAELAEGLSSLDGFERLAAFLKQENYEQAADAAQVFGDGIGSGHTPIPASGGLIESRLSQLGEQVGAAGLTELSEALASMSRAIRNGSRGECQAAFKSLSNTLNRYGKRLRIGRVLRSQLSSLSERRQCMGNGYCSACRSGLGQCQGGGCMARGISMGMPQYTANRSDSPSSSAGTAASLNKFGQPTELRGGREQVQITGQLGHGDSEKEVEISPEGEQNAATAYRKVYAKYQKLSDAVIAEEAIPLAHRQTIKRYFELIHPDRVDPETQLKDVPLDISEPAPARGRREGAE